MPVVRLTTAHVRAEAPSAPPQTSAPVIQFDGVSQVFRTADGGEIHALDTVSIELARHEFLAVLGPSGCGKSTLLRLLAGLIAPTSGNVAIYGQTVTEPRDEIAIVFQKPTLLPWLTAIENVIFPLRHKYGRATKADQERARELLKLVGLAEFGRKYPKELSGGMQQRVGIARALLLDPDILLMDEPFSALDALTREEMGFDLLQIWSDRPKTMVFVTHSIQEAVLLADRIAVMSPRPGRIQRIIDVNLARPRGPETLRDPRFAELADLARHEVLRHKGRPDPHAAV